MSRQTTLIWVAGGLGLLNAAPSCYWAFGGDALLASIGQWLIELRAEMPVLTGAALLGIALGKTLAAVIPLLAARQLTAIRRTPGGPTSRAEGGHPVLWWNLSRLVAAALLLYGAAGLLINTALLVWPGLSLDDPTARLGQALLWYPMLLVWGVVLALGLRRLRVAAAPEA